MNLTGVNASFQTPAEMLLQSAPQTVATSAVKNYRKEPNTLFQVPDFSAHSIAPATAYVMPFQMQPNTVWPSSLYVKPSTIVRQQAAYLHQVQGMLLGST